MHCQLVLKRAKNVINQFYHTLFDRFTLNYQLWAIEIVQIVCYKII